MRSFLFGEAGWKNAEFIKKAMTGLPWLAAGFLALGMLLLCLGSESGWGKFREGYKRALERLMESGKKIAWYDRTQQWLVRNGVKYHLGRELTPMAYLMIRIVLGALGFTAFSLWLPMYGVLAGVGMYFVLPILILYLNRRDNVRMLPDLKHMYHSLEIQTRAGMFVTDSLAELYGSVQEKRLKQALLELAGDLVMRADLSEQLERFQKKFDNRYIDSLCIIILQATESGQSVDLLSDLSEQIKDMEAAVLSQKKDALDRSVTFYQLGILVAVMGLILYACVTQMFSAATGF